MSSKILWLAQGKERNIWASFEELQVAFSSINESCAGIRPVRSAARFNSGNLFCSKASMGESNKSGAPNKEEFLISSCTKFIKGAKNTGCRFSYDFTFACIKMHCTALQMMSLSLSEVTLFATMSIGPPREMSFI